MTSATHRLGRRPVDLRDITRRRRGTPTAAPAQLATDAGAPVPVLAWSGPWPVDERWWDGNARRRARFQVLTAPGEAYLLALEQGRWLVEGIYD